MSIFNASSLRKLESTPFTLRIQQKDSGVAITGDRAGKAILWDIRAGRVLRELEGHGGHVTTVCVMESMGSDSSEKDQEFKGLRVKDEEMLKWHYESNSEASRLNNELIETRRKVERAELQAKKLQ